MPREFYEVAPAKDIERDGSWVTWSVDVEAWEYDSAVEDAVKIFVNDHDGWEWVKDGTRFLARKKGEAVAEEFEISIDYDPVYYANRID